MPEAVNTKEGSIPKILRVQNQRRSALLVQNSEEKREIKTLRESSAKRKNLLFGAINCIGTKGNHLISGIHLQRGL